MPRLTQRYQAILRAYTDSARINEVPIEAEALYIRLLCHSDGKGRYYRDAFTVLAKVLTERFKGGLTVATVEHWLVLLEKAGLITTYEVAGERLFLIERYYDAGNKVKAMFPGPSIPKYPLKRAVHPLEREVHPLKGMKSSPQVTNNPDHPLKREVHPLDVRLQEQEQEQQQQQQQEQEQEQGGREKIPSEPEESEGPLDGIGSERTNQATELLFRYLVPVGFHINAVDEGVKVLSSDSWLGSNLSPSSIAEAINEVGLRCRGAKSPGALALTLLRAEGAQEILSSMKGTRVEP